MSQRFHAMLVREGLAEGTRVKYVQQVREWLDVVGGDDGALAATRQDAEDYLDRLIADEGLAISTVRLRLVALKRFYAFLEDRELLAGRNPVARIKPPKQRKKPNDWLHPDEDEAIYRACVTPQERVLHSLLRYAGLRIGEATSLRQCDVDLGQATLRVTVSKSDAGLRTVPIHPRLKPELERWLDRLERDGLRRADLPLLVTRNLTPMKNAFGWRLMKRVAGRAGVRTLPGTTTSAVKPHTFRRTFATASLNDGMRIESVSRLLGHADTRVTLSTYAELLPETIRAEAEQVWDMS